MRSAPAQVLRALDQVALIDPGRVYPNQDLVELGRGPLLKYWAVAGLGDDDCVHTRVRVVVNNCWCHANPGGCAAAVRFGKNTTEGLDKE